MKKIVDVCGRPLGPGTPPLVVAELSGNHNGDKRRALDLVDAAAAAGAHAVKLQTYTADTLTIDHDGEDFVVRGGPWNGRRLYDLYREASTPWEWHEALFSRARERGLIAFSTPFDETAVDFLESLNAPLYKIASFEMIDHALIERVARTGKPVVMSTGMASVAEIDGAVAAFRRGGGDELVLLHCISGYPTPVEQANLRRILALAARYGCPIGLSDHTPGADVSIAAVALGACMVEKHVTLRRADGGPDAAFSLEPEELRRLVEGTAAAYVALGDGAEGRAAVESGSTVFRRSIYAVADIAEGEPFTRANIRVIRPGFGLPPKELPNVLGRKATRAIARGTALTLTHLGSKAHQK
ncbi:MAG: pseudaminic acid synthase [Azospirillum sp.]|nr:pseudaminic acid synthase [Azospirillum sp.]